MRDLQAPKTLIEAIKYYSDEAVCVELISLIKWGDGKIYCPKCGSDYCIGLKTRKTFQCKEQQCRKQFSIKAGSILEGSNVSLTKWVPAIWLIANDKNGISSCEVARALGVQQRTAWFMLHRVREAMRVSSFKKLSGLIECDESFIGGKEQFKHKDKKIPSSFGKPVRGLVGKTPVFGMLERGGEVRAMVVESTGEKTLEPVVREHIEESSTLLTDAHQAYQVIARTNNFEHEFVNHMDEYVRGEVHTNGLENFWCLFKRSVKGTYVQIAPFHIDAYLSEQIFRYNHRKIDDYGRFIIVLSQIFGKRLTYDQLTGVLPTQGRKAA